MHMFWYTRTHTLQHSHCGVQFCVCVCCFVFLIEHIRTHRAHVHTGTSVGRPSVVHTRTHRTHGPARHHQHHHHHMLAPLARSARSERSARPSRPPPIRSGVEQQQHNTPGTPSNCAELRQPARVAAVLCTVLCSAVPPLFVIDARALALAPADDDDDDVV